MKIREIIWLPQIVEKLERKHHVLPYEVRELLNNRPRIFFRETGHVEGEHLLRSVGTNRGWSLFGRLLHSEACR